MLRKHLNPVMNQANKLTVANYLRNISRYILLIITVLTLVFALLSGAEINGGGVYGIIHNSPNALPWLILLAMIYVAWKWELIGGVIISLSGIFMMYYFHVFSSNFHVITLILTLMIFLLGTFFIISWYLRRDKI